MRKLTDQQRKEIRENKLGLNQTQLAAKYKVCRATIRVVQQNIKLAGTKKDRRRKLTEEQRAEIIENKENLSQRKLATKYNVSRRTIQFTQDPAKLKANKKRRQERGGWKQYYDKDKQREFMQAHRAYRITFIEKEQIVKMDPIDDLLKGLNDQWDEAY